MNTMVLYASKRMYSPSILLWPVLKRVYPFAEFLYNYGWSRRPYMIMASRVDEWTDLDKLGERICFDFSIGKAELATLQVASEQGDKLSAFNTFAEFRRGANKKKCDSLIVQAPDGNSWYVLIFNQNTLSDYV